MNCVFHFLLDSCTVPNEFKVTIPHCNSDFSTENEEKNSFEVGWGEIIPKSSRKRRDVKNPETEKEWFALLTNTEHLHHDQTNMRRKRALDPIMRFESGKNRPKSYIISDNAVLPNGQISSCLERWHYQSTVDLRGFPYWGRVARYSGGGYVANLGYDMVKAFTVVADLHSNGWIDIQTRAVFVEFTVYNANTNLFGIISIFLEFPASSSVVTKAWFQTAQFYLHLASGQMLAHILVLLFWLYFLYQESKQMLKQRCAYFRGFWNWVGIILVFLEFAAVIIFLARLYEVDQNLIQLQENPHDYVTFQYAGAADALFSYVLGVLVFFYNIRLLRLLRFNKTFLVLGMTLSRIAWPILNFCLPFFFGYIAFGLFAFAVFGSELEDYRTFWMTMVTQFSMTLGDFDFEALLTVSTVLGSLYFFAFIALNVTLLINIVLAIINDSFADIQNETVDQQNKYEILEYLRRNLIRSFNEMFRLGKVSPEEGKKKRNYKNEIDDVLPTTTKECMDELDRRGQTLENMMEEADKSLEQEEIIVQRFVLVPNKKRKDLSFQVLCLIESMDYESNSKERSKKALVEM